MDELNVEQLQKQITDLTQSHAELQKNLDDALAVNAKLVQELEKFSDKAASYDDVTVDSSELSFTYEGETYGFAQKKITLKKQVITPIEVLASPELQKQLVEMKSGMIKKI